MTIGNSNPNLEIATQTAKGIRSKQAKYAIEAANFWESCLIPKENNLGFLV